MSDIQGQLIEVVNDLLAIEVNTIVKPNMTATRMRNVAHTLLDIITEYDGELSRIENRLNRVGPPRISTRQGVDLDTEIEKLSSRARHLYADVKKLPSVDEPSGFDESDKYLLVRIKDNCDLIQGIFDAIAARQKAEEKGKTANEAAISVLKGVTRQNATLIHISLQTEERLQLRKIWEVGTEEVKMQTVVHLNGDIFTRVQRELAHGAPEYQRIVKLHNQGVKLAVGYWKSLSELVLSFFKSLLGSRI